MSKTGGKGRISNNLVAASCAAVLTVYAAGYWRTRDEARRLEAQSQERRPSRPATTSAPPTAPAEASVSGPAVSPPVVEAAAEPSVAATTPAPAPEAPKPVKKAPAAAAKVATPPPEAPVAAPAPVAVPEIRSVPVEDPLVPRVAEAAPTTESPPAAPPAVAEAQGWRDGTYTGWGFSNHGDILAQVTIEQGRIVASGIAQCATRYPCDVIDLILFQPVERQNPDVDKVSRATESADAYYYGLVEALKKAEAPAGAAASAK